MSLYHNRIEEKYREANQVLGVYEQRMKAINRRRASKMWVNAFWIVVVVLVVGGLGYFGYTRKDAAAAWVKNQVAGTLNIPPSTSGTNSPSAAQPSASCEQISITDASKSADGKTHISPVSVGKCYNIADADRDLWKKIFSDGTRVDSYAAHIVSESSDKSFTQSVVVDAVNNSLKTYILDLRKSVPTTEVSTPTTAPTEVPPTPTTQAPTAIPTPSVLVVPFPEKERQLSLAELASTMKSHNIPAVASNNTAKDAHDRINWQMWYETGGGNKDYLVLNTLGNNLPPACTNATFLSVTLDSTGTAGEVATQAGDNKVWIVCK